MRVLAVLAVLFLASVAPLVEGSHHNHRVSADERYTALVSRLLESESFQEYLARHPGVAQAVVDATYPAPNEDFVGGSFESADEADASGQGAVKAPPGSPSNPASEVRKNYQTPANKNK